ncbi:hypothetical protein [Pontibacter lucknowensis]|uniref:hypothetical protein n=1 Tax=Pontibacter lucknowensis TaxID=1077936 RepID=UPI00135629D0|nr:hypothetical protein [Pontibacter lucknowensis]
MKKKKKGLISLSGTYEGSLASKTEEIYKVGKASEVGPAIRAVCKARKLTQ